jgi:nitroreductase/NAD-dependent dihydropyrimidine dehydrogenase PreA subunit
MDFDVSTIIDSDLCTGCGRCLKVCPQDTISLVNGKAVVTGKRSLHCGHCEAICPVGAVKVTRLDPDMQRFTNFLMDDAFIPFGQGGTGELARLMASRRSTRNFRPDPVPADMLMDLVKAGCLAPSGTNSQLWKYSIVPDRTKMLEIGRMAMDFFTRLNRIAANPLVRMAVPMLREYHRDYADQVAEGIREFKSGGRDSLFHGAPAAIAISTKPGASCPAEDALLASQNILLAAHTMGLGTCLIGMLIEPARRDRRISQALGLKKEERLHSVIVVGWPDEPWRKVCGRMRPEIITV